MLWAAQTRETVSASARETERARVPHGAAGRPRSVCAMGSLSLRTLWSLPGPRARLMPNADSMEVGHRQTYTGGGAGADVSGGVIGAAGVNAPPAPAPTPEPLAPESVLA